ncbi:Spo0E family sporulation regulatory protein-aspartic acid phosphatase [Thalassobacillus sp. B23F22_16]|uniref:Spo0E family sporulation regulatory protein-aspartic acid phosphatase n=1 Tax=Thalassobacillus sp. B23F22_16 TaxID=3459513 RepID=UPI00373E6A06
MKRFNLLEEHIEQVRLEMYRAYQDNPHGKEVLELSQRLDRLLNELDRRRSPVKKERNEKPKAKLAFK